MNFARTAETQSALEHTGGRFSRPRAGGGL